jgi:Toprim-like
MTFLDNLIPDIQSRLMGHEFGMKVSHDGEYLRGGECPECKQKELWTKLSQPFHLFCGRLSKCGVELSVKDLMPELFEKFNEKYEATPEEPNKTADAYLSLKRGFDLEKIQGWYEQTNWWRPYANKGTAAVRFYLDKEKGIYFERFVEDVTVTDKATGRKKPKNKDFSEGTRKGLWWQPPTLTIEDNSKIIWTEGILDAIALVMNGYNAISILSASSFPDVSIQPYLGKGIEWVLGLDTDKAGIDYALKHAKKLRDLGEKVTILATREDGSKCDWNDLHLDKKLSEADMTRYEILGGITFAEDKKDKAFYTFLLNNEKRSHFCIDFKNSTYSVTIDLQNYAEDSFVMVGSEDQRDSAKRRAFNDHAKLKRIAEFKLNYSYHQKPENGDEGRYVFRVDFANHAPSQELILPSSAFSSATKFRECALKVAGAMFEGETHDVIYLYKQWMRHWKKTVVTLDYVGYDLKNRAYIFNDLAIKNGKIIKLNEEGYFYLQGIGIKTQLENGQRISQSEPVNFLPDFEKAYGMVGLVSLTWNLGALFAEQIRERHSSYPFFELIGEGSSGKSHLVDMLCKLLGRDANVFDPLKSSNAARMRRFADTSNMPVICNEAEHEDRSHSAKISWNDLKDLFEGVIGRSIGVKSNDNQTKTPRFRAALMIVQNITINAGEAFLTRVIHQRLDRSHHTQEGRDADVRLMQLQKEDLSGWMVNVLKQETVILKRFFEAYEKHNRKMQQAGQLKIQRVIHNHSQLLALADCLPLVIPISVEKLEALKKHIAQMAVDREITLQQDHPIVQQFWDTYHYLNQPKMMVDDDAGYDKVVENPLNHSVNPDKEIAVSLNEFREWCSNKRQELLDEQDLKRHLRTSTNPKFIDSNVPIYSRHKKKTLRVWVFKVN